jgi:hypothetical protein
MFPKQHFSKDDYAQIKKGENPASRTYKPAVSSQTDFDARYTKKNNEKHYGYILLTLDNSVFIF